MKTEYEEECLLVQEMLQGTFGVECSVEEAEDFWGTFCSDCFYASWIKPYTLYPNNYLSEGPFNTVGEYVKNFFQSKF